MNVFPRLMRVLLGQRCFYQAIIGLLALILFPVCAKSQAAPATQPAKISFSQPIVISKGGVYRGNWQSNDPKTPAISIATTDPVTIEKSNVRGAGVLISTRKPGVQLTIRDCSALGLNPNIAGVAKGSFIDAYKPAMLLIENNSIEGVGGYGINVNDYSGKFDPLASIKILRNQIRNIDGRFSDGRGGYQSAGEPTPHAIIFQHVHDVPGMEVAWNEIINEPGRSYVNDVINIYESSGTAQSPIRVHDNLIRGLYAINPAKEYNSGCGIITDSGSDLAHQTAFTEIAFNQIISTGNGGICIAAGHDNRIHDNRMISSGRLPDGTAIYAQNIGSYIHPMNKDLPREAFRNNSAYNNLIGWVRPGKTFQNDTRESKRGDDWLPDADPILTRNNNPWPGAITPAAEDQEFAAWKKKLAEEKVVVGVQQ